MNSAAANSAEAGSRRLTIYYVCALSAVALLSILGQVLVQIQLGRQWNDSKVVNLAGRQRMLSQRICKCAVLLADPASPGPARYRDELLAQLPAWRRTHVGLRRGDAELGLPRNGDSATAAVLAELNPTFEAMYAAAERLTTAAALPVVQAAAAELLHDEPSYLRGMDEIVSRYEAAGRMRVERLQTIERALLGLTLFVLLLEGLLVFRPAARGIRNSFVMLRRTSEALRTAKEAAEQANRAKSQFLANVSHELRTPLHAVLAATELLHTAPESAKVDYLETIEDSSRALLCLLNDLLDLSRIEAGKLELSPAPFELREFLRRTVSMFRAAADAKSLRLAWLAADDVPAQFCADQARLRQVLANLLSNAVKFTDAGSITLRVARTGDTSESPALRFEVVDTGIGIAAGDQQRIFESFEQIPAAAEKSCGGAGLGLAIAAQLTALMGGKLTVSSEPSRGSKFAFALPSASGADERRTLAASSHESLCILAADDSPLIRRLLVALLTQVGHRCACVADGSEAIAEFERRHYDLVLLDLRMPKADGVATAASLRASEQRRGLPRRPIILLTADSPAREEILPAGDIDDCLVKPFSGDQLQRTIARFASAGATPATAAAIAPAADAAAADLRRRRVLDRLQGRKRLLDELVTMFLDQEPQLLAELQCASQAQDLGRLRTGVHLLRGQLEMLEVADVADLAKGVERDCEAGALDEVDASLVLLQDAWPQMRRAVAVLSSPG